MSTILRVRLSGADAHLGRVPASDVARLLLGVERAVARATGLVLGRRMKQTGRWGKAVESAVRFRLVDLREGSVVGVLELPEAEQAPDTLEFDTSTLGELALRGTLKTAAGQGSDAEVARALIDLADRLGIGSRYEAVTFESDIAGVPPRVVLDASARERLHHVADRQPPEPRSDTLVGCAPPTGSPSR